MPDNRRRARSASPYEPLNGSSDAVRVGGTVHVARRGLAVLLCVGGCTGVPKVQAEGVSGGDAGAAASGGEVARAELDGQSGAAESGGEPGGDGEPGGRPRSKGIPYDAVACDYPEHWPWSMSSESHPFTVHYEKLVDEDMAAGVLAMLEEAWDFDLDTFGYRAPLPDEGLCGEDERFDVFLRGDVDEAFVEAIDVVSGSAWSTYMQLDPWGAWGGELLWATLTHELSHAMQASDDWWDLEWAYEASATFVENHADPDLSALIYVFEDYQARPHWAFDHGDDYETWFMYGGALALHILSEALFEADPTWLGEVWAAMADEGESNEPDLEDALAEVLEARSGVSLAEAVTTIARWRWFAGALDDGAHLAFASELPEVAVHAPDPEDSPYAPEPAPMLFGTVYLLLGPGEEVSADATDAADVELHVEEVDAALGTWAITVLPAAGAKADPDERLGTSVQLMITW